MKTGIKKYWNGRYYYYKNLSNFDFTILILEKFEEFYLVLSKNGEFNKLKIDIDEVFKKKFIEYFNQITSRNSKNNIYDSLEREKKTIDQITASIIYIVLHLHYDIDYIIFPKGKFTEILNINYAKFTVHLNHHIEKYFKVNESEYYKKVVEYYNLFIDKLDKIYNLSLSKKYKRIELKAKVVNLFVSLLESDVKTPKKIRENFYKYKKELSELLEKYGLDINTLLKLNQYKYLMPQYMAVVLIFFFKDLREIKEKKELNLTNTLSQDLNLSVNRLQTLFDVLKFTVQKVENMKLSKLKLYPREDFIKDLKKILTESFDIDVELIYKLYKLTDLDPETFAKEIVAYKGVTGGKKLIRTIKIRSFTGVIYKRIRENFTRLKEKNLISESNFKKATTLINEVIHVKSSSLTDGSVFVINKENLENIKDNELKQKLSEHFERIWRGYYPKHLFEDPNVPSASKMQLKGNRKENLRTELLKEKLVKSLLNAKNLEKRDAGIFSQLTLTTKKVYLETIQKFGVVKKHKPILTTLVKKEGVIAIETPVWIVLKDGSYYTGHIDLIAVIDDTLIIADNKDTEEEIFRFLPQICCYAYLLKQKLGFQNFDKIICVGFSKDIVYSFNPKILEGEILKFVKEINSTRTIPLKCIKLKNKTELDLQKEIEKLVK